MFEYYRKNVQTMPSPLINDKEITNDDQNERKQNEAYRKPNK